MPTRPKPLFSKDFLSRALGKKVNLKSPAERVWTDTRTLRKRDLFAAVEGDHFDGHDFVWAAYKAGAVGAIISNKNFKERANLPATFCLIHVPNTTQALRKLAMAHRRRLKIPVVAVAGSNGKTTTKEWIAFLLQLYIGPKNVFKTLKSNNSILGIALSLLQIRNEKVAVIEIGIDEPGWMNQHLAVVQPTHGIITTIAEEHLNRLKNIETVAKEELKLLSFLKKPGRSFAANLDCDWISKSKRPKDTLSYGLQARADIEGLFKPPHILHAFGFEWLNPLPGRHNAQNLLAALTTLRLLKPEITHRDLLSISKKLSNFEGEAHRSRLLTLKNQARVFDDCYNANPDSMEKSLQAFLELSSGCVQRVVLGDMLDLGESTDEAHRRILNRALVLGFDQIFLFGENFERALSKTNAADHVHSYKNIESLAEHLKKDLKSGEFLFLKGSRGMKLERLLDKF